MAFSTSVLDAQRQEAVETLQPIVTGIAAFLIEPGVLKLRGFITYFLQFGAVFVSLRALWPVAPIKIALGRPIFVFNFDLASDSKPYGGCEALSDFADLQNDPASNGDRTIVCYKDLSGDLEVIKELSDWGQDMSEVVPTSRPPHGGVHPPERWVSEWSEHRHVFGCPTERGIPFLSLARKKDVLSSLMCAFRERYKYEPEITWPGRDVKGTAMTYDESYTSCSLCEYFEAKCKSDKERTIVIIGIEMGGKTINVIQLSNNTHESVNDIHIELGGKGGQCGTVVKSVADVEGMNIIINTFAYARISIKSIPPKSSRFLITETRGRPLEKSDVKVATPLSTKFNVAALRWIAGLSFGFTMLVAVITYYG